ncbi:hypothetical protein QAD02_013538 [Eretmocerus hayati]|uniref:Uncharacterized protein n=1 Tax=Eretmocerus hayati TaxID=131215 RepID=A0ACC2P2T8_9HYME|nr:hypothetical protein QAD02_013538 [Eretmocerus hayati]
MDQRRSLWNRVIEAEEPEIDVVPVDDWPALDACEQATRKIEEAAILATKQANNWAADVQNHARQPAHTTTSSAPLATANISQITNQAHDRIAEAQTSRRLLTSPTIIDNIFAAADAEAADKTTRQTHIWADEFKIFQQQSPLAEVNVSNQSAAITGENNATLLPINPRQEGARNGNKR